MTKSELVGAAYLKLTGGYPNTDASTWWEDVDLLIAPAVNYVMNADYFIGKREEGEEKILQPLFIQTFYVDVTFDSVRKMQSFMLPKKPISLPKNRAVPFVGGLGGDAFVPIQQGGSTMQKYYGALKTDQTSYELEGMKGFLRNANPLLSKIMVKEIVSASDIGDDEEITLPDGGELQVIGMMVDFFIGQKQLPKDYYNTNKEPNTQAQ